MSNILGLHKYGLRKLTTTYPNGRKVISKAHRWEHWREIEKIRMLHLKDEQRALVGQTVVKFFTNQFIQAILLLAHTPSKSKVYFWPTCQLYYVHVCHVITFIGKVLLEYIAPISVPEVNYYQILITINYKQLIPFKMLFEGVNTWCRGL